MKKIILAALIVSSISSPLHAEWAPKDYFTAGCMLVGLIGTFNIAYGKSTVEKPFRNRITFAAFSIAAFTMAACFHFATPTR
jgi:multisubunit Na+/H+ antiporter MnhB subunit